jgi:hypothetical protein
MKTKKTVVPGPANNAIPTGNCHVLKWPIAIAIKSTANPMIPNTDMVASLIVVVDDGIEENDNRLTI